MPKLLNLTIEEKAERYASKYKKSVNLTTQEKADKYDENCKKASQYCLKWTSKNQEKVSLIAKAHYEINKFQYNKNSCIRLKKIYDAKKIQKSSETVIPESTNL